MTEDIDMKLYRDFPRPHQSYSPCLQADKPDETCPDIAASLHIECTTLRYRLELSERI